MNKIRRINFFAGPGAGKTTTSSAIFALAKTQTDKNVEYAQEYIKTWAWEGRIPTGFDQLHIFSEQLRREEIPLRNGVDFIVSDSPLFLSAIYAKNYNVSCWKEILSICKLFEVEYPSLNIFIDRKDKKYQSAGRFGSYDEAKKMDDYIKQFLNDNQIDYTVLSFDNYNSIADTVINVIK